MLDNFRVTTNIGCYRRDSQAHRLQEENTIGKAGTLAGKIVLTPDP